MKLMIKVFFLFIMQFFIFEVSNAIGFTVADTNTCVGTVFIVEDTSTPPTGKVITDRTFIFGDGTTKTTTDTFSSHIYIIPTANLTIAMTLTYDDNTTESFTYDATFSVFDQPNALFTVDKNITCPGVGIEFTPNNTHGDGMTFISFKWDYGDGTLNSGINTVHSHAYSQIKDYVITLEIEDDNRCKDTFKDTVQIISSPPVNFKALDPFCKDSIVKFENTTKNKQNIVSWNWRGYDSTVTFGGVPSHTSGLESPEFTLLVPDTFRLILTATNIYNCTSSTTQTFIVDRSPELMFRNVQGDTVVPDKSLCFGESVQFSFIDTANSAVSYFFRDSLWLEKIKGDTVILFTPKNSKTYTVYAKSPNCPAIGYDIKLKVVPPISPKVEIEPNKILKGNKTAIKLNLNGAIIDSMKWIPSADVHCATCDSTTASPIFTTMFKADIFYSHLGHSCQTIDSGLLTIDQSCIVDSLNIPNAFTPNGDAKNDIFYVRSFSLKLVKSFNIYNRWGNLVFSEKNVAPNDYQFGWNGKEFNTGEELPSGMYVYHIVAICHNDQELTFQGEITIIR